MDLLGESEMGKAERGDIRGNAATIEKTLESFGIEPKWLRLILALQSHSMRWKFHLEQNSVKLPLGTRFGSCSWRTKRNN